MSRKVFALMLEERVDKVAVQLGSGCRLEVLRRVVGDWVFRAMIVFSGPPARRELRMVIAARGPISTSRGVYCFALGVRSLYPPPRRVSSKTGPLSILLGAITKD